MTGTLRRRALAVLVALAGLAGVGLGAAPAASAHPLGNFTVNYFSALHVEPHAVRVDVVVDRAEIPTLQAFPDARAGRVPAGADTWRTQQCALLAGQAVLVVGPRRAPLSVTGSRLEVLPGAAGLATSRLECTVRTGALDLVGAPVSYTAPTSSGRVGWHEVVASGDGTRLAGSDVRATSVSDQLRHYPQDLLTSPLDQRTARFEVRAGSGVVSGDARSAPLTSGPIRGLDRFTTAYTDLVSRASLTPGFAVVAVLLSLLLGAAHAFAPGHGKTLMAAYLVGREGTWRQAAVIGVSVTVTHTLGVLLLGAALAAAAIAAPEQVYPWLGVLSGVLLAGIGVTLLRAARRGHVHGPGGHTHGPAGHVHDHAPDVHDHDPAPHVHAHDHDPAPHVHDHDHAHDHDHDHDHAPAAAVATGRAHALRGRSGTLRLAAVGLAGGLVPSPSALLVLLGGIALGRAWFGALLVLCYGIGMAAALVGTGLLLVLARDRFERWSAARAGRGSRPLTALGLRLTRALPLVTAVAVVAVGAVIAVRSAVTI